VGGFGLLGHFSPNGFILSSNNGNQHVRVRIQMPSQNLITKINHFADSSSTTASSFEFPDLRIRNPETSGFGCYVSHTGGGALFTPQVILWWRKGKRKWKWKWEWKWLEKGSGERGNGSGDALMADQPLPIHPPTLLWVLRPWAHSAHCFHWLSVVLIFYHFEIKEQHLGVVPVVQPIFCPRPGNEICPGNGDWGLQKQDGRSPGRSCLAGHK